MTESSKINVLSVLSKAFSLTERPNVRQSTYKDVIYTVVSLHVLGVLMTTC